MIWSMGDTNEKEEDAIKKNNVPVEYVLFEDEGHGFRKKKNRITGYKAILDFLDKYLKNSEI